MPYKVIFMDEEGNADRDFYSADEQFEVIIDHFINDSLEERKIPIEVKKEIPIDLYSSTREISTNFKNRFFYRLVETEEGQSLKDLLFNIWTPRETRIFCQFWELETRRNDDGGRDFIFIPAEDTTTSQEDVRNTMNHDIEFTEFDEDYSEDFISTELREAYENVRENIRESIENGDLRCINKLKEQEDKHKYYLEKD